MWFSTFCMTRVELGKAIYEKSYSHQLLRGQLMTETRGYALMIANNLLWLRICEITRILVIPHNVSMYLADRMLLFLSNIK